MNSDIQYQRIPYQVPQRPHKYGENVCLVADPYLLTIAMELSSKAVQQPRFNELIDELYHSLFSIVCNTYLRREILSQPTRMSEINPEAIFTSEVIAKQQAVVLVDLARAGILPSMLGLKFFANILDPGHVRVDHIFINRATNEKHQVVGANVAGTKIGGPVDDATLIIADPMGASGTSMINCLDLYKKNVKGKPRQVIAVALIITPEFIANLHRAYPDVKIVALRLDRGLSKPEILATVPGTHAAQERGLNDTQYIVPGAGGVGELMNNAFV